MYGNQLNCAKLQRHRTKLRKCKPFWQTVGSQAVPELCQRIERAYLLFFKPHKKGVSPPEFKKIKKYKSFTLQQAGYKFIGGNRVKIPNCVYQYWNSREIEETVKTLTIKRTALGELLMIVVVDDYREQTAKFKTGKIAGFDFCWKTFLTISDGTKIELPQFREQSINAIKTASCQHSQKRKESANRERARKNIVCKHEDVANRRCNWFWKMARELTDKFNVLCFETLNIKGMQRLGDRQISALAFGEFLQILQWIATKQGKQVVFLWRGYPSSNTCSDCDGVLESVDISVREWRWPCCQSINGQDENAALNIQAVGASTVRLGDVRQARPAIAV
jgi:putative transposase